jgi:hypothetical protein
MRIPAIFVMLAVAVMAFYPVPSGAAEDCLAEPWPLRQRDCLVEQATVRRAPELCLRSEDPAVRWQCIAILADRARNMTLCELLPEEDLQVVGVSRDLCRSELAVSWHDPSLCRQLATPNMADACLMQLVRNGGDKSLCEEIEVEPIREACLNP